VWRNTTGKRGQYAIGPDGLCHFTERTNERTEDYEKHILNTTLEPTWSLNGVCWRVGSSRGTRKSRGLNDQNLRQRQRIGT